MSETSKADILRYCDVPAERVIVVLQRDRRPASAAPPEHGGGRARPRALPAERAASRSTWATSSRTRTSSA
ncbi:MAG: hypothetical protein MZV64_73010 [Ignavibacteriales bacterium]|nr:hypothetical protein [Ignavibacteriales bacterium]